MKKSESKNRAPQKAGDDPCWKGYKMEGMKTKNGVKVPNCVKDKNNS